MINIIIQKKKNSKIIILTKRSNNLEMCDKKSSDLYLKTEGVNIRCSSPNKPGPFKF